MKISKIINNVFDAKIHYVVVFISFAIIGMHTTSEYASEGIGEAVTNLMIGMLIWICGVIFGMMYISHHHKS